MEKYLIKFNDQEYNIYQKDNKLYINYDEFHVIYILLMNFLIIILKICIVMVI